MPLGARAAYNRTMDARASTSPAARTRKAHVYDLLDGTGAAPRWVAIALQALIALNTLVIIAETVPAADARFHAAFAAFEYFSVAVYTAEYLLRLWACTDAAGGRYTGWSGRLRYAVTPLALVDLLAVLPVYLSPILPGVDLRILRIVRLVKLFRFSRYQEALASVAEVIRQEAAAMVAALAILMIAIVLAAAGMFVLEHDAQPDRFVDIPTSMWWAVVTLTTIGYGDMVPVTGAGRLLGSFVAFAGIAVVAIPSGIIASGFVRQFHVRRERFEEDVFRSQVENSGGIDLEAERLRLGLSAEDAQLIVDAVVRQLPDQCPHCGGALGHEPHTHRLRD